MPNSQITIRFSTRALAWIFGLSLVVIMSFVVATHPVALPAKDYDVSKVFGSLIIVAILVERIIEVFVTLWSDPAKAELELLVENDQINVKKFTDDIALLVKEDADPATLPPRKAAIKAELSAKQSDLNTANDRLGSDKKALLPYRTATERMALWFGMLIGVLAAAVGFRLLAQVVNVSGISSPIVDQRGAAAVTHYNQQYVWFVALDVLLTGAVLAGGTKAIHAIFTLYDSFMQQSRQLAEKPR